MSYFNPVTTLIVLVLFGAAGAMLASARGSNKWRGFFLGASAVGLIILLIIFVGETYKKITSERR